LGADNRGELTAGLGIIGEVVLRKPLLAIGSLT